MGMAGVESLIVECGTLVSISDFKRDAHSSGEA